MSWYDDFGPIFWVFGTIVIAIIIGLICRYYDNKISTEYHNKMNAICAPSFFVEEERAADHLIRVKCLSEQGEKKEILVKDNVK